MQLRNFIGVIRELSFSEIKDEASIRPRILVLSDSEAHAQLWRDELFGEVQADFIYTDLVSRAESVDPFSYDAIVVAGDLSPEISRRWLELYRSADEASRIVEFDPSHHGSTNGVEQIRRRIANQTEIRSIAIGRFIPAMRPAAAAEVIMDTSKANAQFAAVSNIPALVPVIGNIISAGADFIVLTKNQLMMIYKLAAIYDRDLGSQIRIYSEMIPVVGVGMLWRTIARQVAALVPFLIGAVPKVMIAYVGTYAIGQAATFYYQHNEKMSRAQLDAVYRDAIDRWKQSLVRQRLGDLGRGKRLEAIDKTPTAETTVSDKQDTRFRRFRRALRISEP